MKKLIVLFAILVLLGLFYTNYVFAADATIPNLSSFTEAFAANDLFEGINTSDTTTPPASANGFNQKVTYAKLAKIRVISKSNNYTLGTDSSGEVYGTLVLATASMTLTLPNAGDTDVGMSFCIYSTTAAVIRVNPNDADKIRLNGTLGTAGYDIYSAGAAGNYACFLLTDSASDVAVWTVLGTSGTWTVGS